MKLARWLVTNICNYNCSICWNRQKIAYGEKIEPEEEINVDLYFQLFKQLNPRVLDCTGGGEPLIRKGFIELIGKLTNNTPMYVALTTNISRNLDKFVQQVNPKGVSTLVCSFHPDMETERPFLAKLQLLKVYGFNPRVNFVLSPFDMFQFKYYKEFFEKEGFTVHVDIYASIPENPYKFNEAELKIINEFASSERKEGMSENIDKCYCDAGIEVIQITPNLDVYSCLQYSLMKRGYMGNLKDKFNINDLNILCDIRRQCAGCDRDHVTIKEVRD